MPSISHAKYDNTLVAAAANPSAFRYYFNKSTYNISKAYANNK